MNQQWIVQFSEIQLIVVIVLLALAIITANIYDLRVAYRRRYFSAVTAKLRWPRQPKVTVLVYATNNINNLAVCLDSIVRTRYRNLDIVVVDNMSSGGIRQELLSYRQKHPNLYLRFYSKRKRSATLTALKQAYSVSKKGDIVFVIDTNIAIDNMLIKQSVARFMSNSNFDALRLNEQLGEQSNANSLSMLYVRLSRHVYEKSMSLMGLGYAKVGQVGFIYSSAVLLRAKHDELISYCYVPDLKLSNLDSLSSPYTILQRESSSWLIRPKRYILTKGSHPRNLKWLFYRYLNVIGKIIFVLSVFGSTYFLYVAASLQTSTPLTISWLVVIAWLLLSIWMDESTGSTKKLGLIFCLPVAYFFIYAYSVAFIFILFARHIARGLMTWMKYTRRLILLAERYA